MRVLILKPSALGDVVQALPVARLLRKHFPKAEIDWWIDAANAPLLEGDPDITRLVLFHRKRWAVPWYWHELVKSMLDLRKAKYDLVLDLQALARSSLVAWLSNAGLVIGLDDPREGAPTFYDIRVPRPTQHTHAIDWYLDVLRTINVPVSWEFEWLPVRPSAAARINLLMNGPATHWIAIQPGAHWRNKQWPAEHFAALVRRLAQTVPRVRFVILGAVADQPKAEIIAAGAPDKCLNITGRTSLPELVECLRKCTLLIGNDSGPMHIAAALGKPVIALFGPTDPSRTGPYRQIHRVLQLSLPCVPCMSKKCRATRPMACLRDLTPETVAERVLAVLNELDQAKKAQDVYARLT